jgi:hypothetical protein
VTNEDIAGPRIANCAYLVLPKPYPNPNLAHRLQPSSGTGTGKRPRYVTPQSCVVNVRLASECDRTRAQDGRRGEPRSFLSRNARVTLLAHEWLEP